MVLAIDSAGEEGQAAEPEIQDQASRNRQHRLTIAHSKKWGKCILLMTLADPVLVQDLYAFHMFVSSFGKHFLDSWWSDV